MERPRCGHAIQERRRKQTLSPDYAAHGAGPSGLWTPKETRMTDGPKTLPDAIDAVEEAYEFMLAYAAQGRAREDGDDDIREHLRRAEAGLAIIAAMDLDLQLGSDTDHKAFIDLVRQDAGRARAAMRFVLAQKAIGSQIVDNLNASIHLRTLLTDLFLLDEALKISGI
jgi:hypothetical protein